MQPGNAPQRVFISYSSRDRDAAVRLCRSLEESGVPCWIAPRDIPAGYDYSAAITEAIDSCIAMVLVFSQNADNNSDQIKRELVLASDARKLVIPARVEDLVPRNPSFRYQLAERQWVDLFGDWHSGIGQIVARVRRDPPRASPAPAPDAVAVTPPARATGHPGPRWRALALGAVALMFLGAAAYGAIDRYWPPSPNSAIASQPAPPAGPPTAASPALPDVSGAMNAVITGSLGNVRAGPRSAERQVTQLARGTQIRVVEDLHNDTGGWARIDSPVAGWIAKSALVALPPPAGFRTNAVAFSDVGPGVTLRSGPGQSSPSIREIPNGTPLRIVADREGWVQIDLPESGWIIKWAYRHQFRP